MRRLPPSEVDKWRLKALLLVCHAFPRNRYMEPVNGEIGRLLLPHLDRVLGHYDAICVKHGEQPIFVHELASTLLAASRFSNAEWKAEAISRTKKLLEDDKDPYMNAWLAYRESAIARMFGKEAESEDALQRFLQFSTTLGQEEFKLDPRFNAQRGDLIISFSENLIRQGKLLEAKKELIEWKPLGGSQSTLEGITLRARDITLGKVLRYQGFFEEARTLLEGVLQNSVLDDYFEGTGWYRVLLSNVADLYCELGLPANSEKLIMQELSPMKERGTQDIATGRRLQMSLAETYLQRHMYAKAESLLLDLQRAFMSSDGPEYTSDVNTFRIWILLARISHAQSCWDGCLARWKHALSVLERLNLDRGFNSGLVRCSIADVLFMTGHRTEAAEMFRKAQADMTSEPRIFWIPLFNSQWHDFIMDRLKEIEY
ncbi:hypothetical protein Plec18167_007216 [Paecilomyces lecythidis]|uniref:Uncharacterized protein n=1 Tax=Paecilomyces lecythidis TaxID=3004212 RepID=A0ABR3X6I0_9EURO